MTAHEKRRLQLSELQYLQSHPEEITAKIDDVFETLSDTDEEVRAWAADCLQEVECLDGELATRVATLCRHEDDVVVNWACRTLGKALSVDLCQDQLREVLASHPNLGVKQSAAEALCELSEANSSTKEALREAASSSDPRLQRLAKRALEKFDRGAGPNG